MNAICRSAVWFVVAIALGLPRAADGQTFTLTLDMVNDGTDTHVNVMGGAVSRCFAGFTCLVPVNAGATIRLAAAGSNGSGAVPCTRTAP